MKDMLSPLISSLTEGDPRSKTMVTQRENLAKKLKRPILKDMEFSSHELQIAQDVLNADDIKVSFQDIGGMHSQKEDIFDNIILPIRHWIQTNQQGKDTSLVHCPTGIMLHGKPGTGELIATAI